MRIERAENSSENRQRLAATWRDNSAAAIEFMSRQGIHGAGLPLEFWRVNGASLLVTETVGETLYIIAYQGCGVVEMLEGMIRIARVNGCRVIRYETVRKGFSRMLRKFAPQYLGGDEWEIKVA